MIHGTGFKMKHYKQGELVVFFRCWDGSPPFDIFDGLFEVVKDFDTRDMEDLTGLGKPIWKLLLEEGIIKSVEHKQIYF